MAAAVSPGVPHTLLKTNLHHNNAFVKRFVKKSCSCLVGIKLVSDRGLVGLHQGAPGIERNAQDWVVGVVGQHRRPAMGRSSPTFATSSATCRPPRLQHRLQRRIRGAAEAFRELLLGFVLALILIRSLWASRGLLKRRLQEHPDPCAVLLGGLLSAFPHDYAVDVSARSASRERGRV